MESPYVRPALQATAQRRVDPGVEVSLWVDRLSHALEGGLADEPAEQAHELLVNWAALQRVRPELLEEAEAEPVLREAGRRLEADARLLIARARPSNRDAAQAEAEAWLTAARALDESYELDAPDDGEDEATRANDLLREIDDAELLIWALSRWALRGPRNWPIGRSETGLGFLTTAHLQSLTQSDDPTRELAAAIKPCLNWLRDRSDVFIAAAALVQAVGLALRPNLAYTDRALAATAEKFTWLLDACQHAETDLALHGLLPLTAEELLVLPEIGPVFEAAYWLPPVTDPVRAAAAEPAEPTVHWRGLWRSPDGRLAAHLVVPARPAAGEQQSLTLAFYDERGEPAGDFAADRVELAGIATSAEGGVACFTLGQLRAGGASPELKVDGQQWELDTQ